MFKNKISQNCCKLGLIAGLFFFQPSHAQEEASFSDSTSTMKSGFFVEPSVTYEMGDTTVNYPSPLADSHGDLDGFGIGARLGYHIGEIAFVGFDARYSLPKFKDSAANDYEANAVAANWGPVVGVQMPNIGLRVWATYVMDGFLDPEKDGSFDVKFNDPKGYRVGAGFRVQMVSLNLEYQDVTYDSTTLQQVGPFSPGTDFGSVEQGNKSWIASVSFPFEL